MQELRLLRKEKKVRLNPFRICSCAKLLDQARLLFVTIEFLLCAFFVEGRKGR